MNYRKVVKYISFFLFFCYNTIRIRYGDSMKKIYIIIPCLVILLLSICFSAFTNILLIDNIGLTVRIKEDIRITNVTHNTSDVYNGGVSGNFDYNVDSISGSVTLPNSDSYVKYRVTVTNIEGTEMGILNLNLPSNLDYEIVDGYNEGDKLCDDSISTKCTYGSVTTFYVKIKYKEGATVSASPISFTANFNFRVYYDITYVGFLSTSGLPSGMLVGDSKDLPFSSTNGIPYSISVSGATASYNNSIWTLSNATGDITVTRLYSVTYIDFTGDTTGLTSTIPSTGGSITFDNTSGIPSSVTVTGATSDYSSKPILSLSSITDNVTITGLFSNSSVVVVDNGDGSVTTTTINKDNNGNPTDKTVETVDASGNVSTQEIIYVNGEEVVTGYTIDTSDNPNGTFELDGTNSVDTGVIAFDGNDFTITLVAKFNINDISGTANPVVAFRDYSDGGCMVNIHNSSVRWMNENNTSSVTTGKTLSFGFTKYTGGSSTSGSYYFRWISKYNNYYWTYGTGETEKQLKIVIRNQSNVISAYIYNDSDTLVAHPASTSTMPLTTDFSSMSLDDITVVLGYFNNNGTNRYTKFDVISFSVEKTIS